MTEEKKKTPETKSTRQKVKNVIRRSAIGVAVLGAIGGVGEDTPSGKELTPFKPAQLVLCGIAAVGLSKTRFNGKEATGFTHFWDWFESKGVDGKQEENRIVTGKGDKYPEIPMEVIRKKKESQNA